MEFSWLSWRLGSCYMTQLMRHLYVCSFKLIKMRCFQTKLVYLKILVLLFYYIRGKKIKFTFHFKPMSHIGFFICIFPQVPHWHELIFVFYSLSVQLGHTAWCSQIKSLKHGDARDFIDILPSSFLTRSTSWKQCDYWDFYPILDLTKNNWHKQF